MRPLRGVVTAPMLGIGTPQPYPCPGIRDSMADFAKPGSRFVIRWQGFNHLSHPGHIPRSPLVDLSLVGWRVLLSMRVFLLGVVFVAAVDADAECK